MAPTRRLLRRDITYSSAHDKEVNILHQLGYHSQQIQFFALLDDNRSCIRDVVAHHLGLSSCMIHVADKADWLHGSFNVCVPVDIQNWKGKRVLVRFPLLYRVGEAFRPGNADEKIRCEAGTYAWFQGNCADVPIPQLYGFGLSTGQTFTRRESLPALSRWIQSLRQWVLSSLGYPIPSNYVRHPRDLKSSLGTGYLLIEYIDHSRGRMLSESWEEKRHDAQLRKTLFRSLSKIIQAAACIPLPSIGSFIIDENGFLKLNNRPLTLEIQDLENEKIPVDVPRSSTYSTVDAYVNDILALHESRLHHQPNAVSSIQDCLFQVAALTVTRTVRQSFFRPGLRRGPFFMSFTNLHQSNIPVDENWNVTCLVDLEWTCSRPAEMIHPLYWLTSEPVDGIDPLDYGNAHAEFMA